MLAVTIGVGPVYGDMARHAAARVRALTGLETTILGDAELARCVPRSVVEKGGPMSAAALKFMVFELFPEEEDILYFDSDLMFLRPWSPQRFAGSTALVVVRDLWFLDHVRHESALAEIPEDVYFNFGLFIANRSHHAALFGQAMEQMGRVHELGWQLYDQTLINRLAHQTRLPIRYLDRRHNFIGYALDSETSGVLSAFAAHAPLRRVRVPEKRTTLALMPTAIGPDPARGPHFELDEDAARMLAGTVARFRRAGEAGQAIELREDHTIGLGWSEDATYWYPLRTPRGTELTIQSRDRVSCRMTLQTGGLWRGRASPLDALPGEGRGRMPPSDLERWRRPSLDRRLFGAARRHAKNLVRRLTPVLGGEVLLSRHRGQVLADLLAEAGLGHAEVAIAGLESTTQEIFLRQSGARPAPEGRSQALVFGRVADIERAARVGAGGLIAGTWDPEGLRVAEALGRPLQRSGDGVWHIRT